MGTLQTYENALEAFRQALLLQPDPHPDRAESLDNIASALWSCFRQNGNIDILGEVISCSRKALTLRRHPTQIGTGVSTVPPIFFMDFTSGTVS